MPKPARICNKQGCPEIVIGDTYCPTHKLNGWKTSTRNKQNPPGWQRTRAFILRRDNNTCTYCGREATEVDHITPLSQGGTHLASNLTAACSKCNREKNYAERSGKTWTPPNRFPA